jgi:hypothetical protein
MASGQRTDQEVRPGDSDTDVAKRQSANLAGPQAAAALEADNGQVYVHIGQAGGTALQVFEDRRQFLTGQDLRGVDVPGGNSMSRSPSWDSTVTSDLAGHQATIWKRMGRDLALSKKAGKEAPCKKGEGISANPPIAAAVKDLPPAIQAAILALAKQRANRELESPHGFHAPAIPDGRRRDSRDL